MLPNTITELILVLLAPATVGAVLSWAAERWPRFQELPSGWKTVSFGAVTFTFGGVAGLLQILVEGAPGTTVDLLNLLFLASQTGILALLGSQVWHEKFNKVRKQLDTLPELLERAGASGDLVTIAKMIRVFADTLESLEQPGVTQIKMSLEGQDGGEEPGAPVGVATG